MADLARTLGGTGGEDLILVSSMASWHARYWSRSFCIRDNLFYHFLTWGHENVSFRVNTAGQAKARQ